MKHAKNCHILRTSPEDFSNGGATARHRIFTLFWDCLDFEALDYCETHGIDPDTALWVDMSESCGRPYYRAKPVKGKGRGYAGPMFGGTYIECRECFDYPIPVHDRFETWEEYDVLSR